MCIPYLVAGCRAEEKTSHENVEWLQQLVSLYQTHMCYAAEIVEL